MLRRCDGMDLCSTCYRTLRSEGYNPTLVRTARWVVKRFRLAYEPSPDVCPTGALTPPRAHVTPVPPRHS